jgi:SAM-dependent methyltransferase
MKDADLVVCPACGGSLVAGTGARCSACGEHYPAHGAQGCDLRLQRPKRVTLDFDVGAPLETAHSDFGPLTMNPSPEVDFSRITLPPHLTPEMASYLPAAPDANSVCLDLGCGGGQYRGAIECAGYRWVGADYADDRAPLLADAHALPFRDATFDLVVSLAVLEHIRYPHVMMREVARVLRPGGVFFGSVAYLVPFHLESFYNMTHYGTLSALEYAGLGVERIASDPNYLGIRALSFAGLFQGAPRVVAYAAVRPLVALSRAWWWLGERVKPARFNATERLLFNTGAFVFVARKPVTPRGT